MDKQVIEYPKWHDDARKLKTEGKTNPKIADIYGVSSSRISQITSPNWRNYFVLFRQPSSSRPLLGSLDISKYEFKAIDLPCPAEIEREKRAKKKPPTKPKEVLMGRAFEAARKFEDGMTKSGAKITCSKCGKTDFFFKPGGSVNPAYLEKEFKRLGWIVGGSSRTDICPEDAAKLRGGSKVVPITPIVELPKIAEEVVKEEPVINVSAPAVEVTTEVKPTGIEAIVSKPVPTELGMTERRIILAKLNEVYEDEVTGYREDWTDAKVATDLGVPVEWIAELRDQNFGPETNAFMRKAAADAAAANVAKDAEALERLSVLIDKKLEQMQELDTKVVKILADIETKLNEIDETVDRFEQLKTNLQQSDDKMRELLGQFDVSVDGFKKKFAELKGLPSA